jgi:hypothetical protein
MLYMRVGEFRETVEPRAESRESDEPLQVLYFTWYRTAYAQRSAMTHVSSLAGWVHGGVSSVCVARGPRIDEDSVSISVF